MVTSKSQGFESPSTQVPPDTDPDTWEGVAQQREALAACDSPASCLRQHPAPPRGVGAGSPGSDANYFKNLKILTLMTFTKSAIMK